MVVIRTAGFTRSRTTLAVMVRVATLSFSLSFSVVSLMAVLEDLTVSSGKFLLLLSVVLLVVEWVAVAVPKVEPYSGTF